MIERKGISTVVSSILIILLTIAGVAVLIGVFIGNVGKSTNDDSASCLGIDLKLNSCVIFPLSVVNTFFPEEVGVSVLMNVERSPGGGEIKGLRFAVTDSLGNTHFEDPVNLKLGNLLEVNTNYSDFVEYDSDDALLRNLTYTPVSVSVSALVGNSLSICPATRPSINCVVWGAV